MADTDTVQDWATAGRQDADRPHRDTPRQGQPDAATAAPGSWAEAAQQDEKTRQEGEK